MRFSIKALRYLGVRHLSLYIPLLYRRELRRERNRCHYFDFFPALPSLRSSTFPLYSRWNIAKPLMAKNVLKSPRWKHGTWGEKEGEKIRENWRILFLHPRPFHLFSHKMFFAEKNHSVGKFTFSWHLLCPVPYTYIYVEIPWALQTAKISDIF